MIRKTVRQRLIDGHSVSQTGCWIWQGEKSSCGYGRIYLPVNKKMVTASRLSYETFVGEIPQGACVCHKCDTPACINPGHLFLGTQRDNVQDMIAKGRRKANSKLTEDAVREIRASCEKTIVLSRKYGVTQQEINCVKRRATWKNVA